MQLKNGDAFIGEKECLLKNDDLLIWGFRGKLYLQKRARQKN